MVGCHVTDLRRWGPWAGRSAGLPVGPPTFSFFSWAASGVYLLMVEVWALVQLSFFSGEPFDPCEARVAISDWSVFAPWPKKYDCPPFLVKTCTHRNLEGHVEFGDLLLA